jgi:hypothetical protein
MTGGVIMRYKCLAAAICAVLLASCGTPATPEVTPTPTPAPTADITPTPVPTPTPNPNPNGYPDIDALPELPPFELDEIYTRRYPYLVTDVIPGDDYGELYPYFGSIGIRENYGTFPIFGFCTADGEIICDPVFSYVNDRVVDGKLVYIAQKRTGTRTEYYMGEFGYLQHDVSLDIDKAYVVAHDGSFASEYDIAWFSNEDVIIVCRDGKWGSIDHNGNTLVPCVYDQPFHYNDGIAVVCKDGKWGSIDHNGNALVPCVYAYSFFYYEGLAAVTKDIGGGYRYIDRLNNTVFEVNTQIPEKYLADIKERYENEDYYEGGYGYGDVLIRLSFREGLAPCLDGDLYGYIDTAGAVVIPARFTSKYCNFAEFYNARAIVSVGERSALIDKLSNEVVPLGDYYIDEAWGYGEAVYRLRDKNWNLLGLVTRDGDPFDGERVPPSDSGYDYSFTDKAETVREIFDEFYQYGDYYAVRLGSYGGLADVNSNWVVKVSLLDSLDD